MILIKNEFIKDNRDDLSNLNEIERINNQEAVVLNVNNLEKKQSELKRITTEDITNVLQMNSIKNPISYDLSLNRKKYSLDNAQETKSIDHTMPSLSDKYNRRKTTGDFSKKSETRKFNIFSVTRVHSQEESTNDKTVSDSQI